MVGVCEIGVSLYMNLAFDIRQYCAIRDLLYVGRHDTD